MKDPLREAAAVLQGTRLPVADTAAVLDSALIVEVAGALKVIRRKLPRLQDAISYRSPNVLRIKLAPDVGRRVVRNATPITPHPVSRFWRFPLRDGVPFVDLAMLDSLNRHYAPVRVDLMAMGKDSALDPWFELSVVFGHYVNVPRLIGTYKAVPGATWVQEGEEFRGDTETRRV